MTSKVKLPRKILSEEEKTGKVKIPRKVLSEEEKAGTIKAPRKRLTEEEKAAKKAEQELDKALKKSVQEAKRNEAPNNAFKFMTILLPEALVSKYDGLPALLIASDVKSVSVPNPLLDNLVVFRRDVIRRNIGDNFQIHEVVNSSEEDNLILVMYPDEYIPKVSAQVVGTGSSLIDYVRELQALLEGKKLTLFFMELDKYFRKLKKNTQQDFRNRVLNDDYDDLLQNQPTRRKKNHQDLPVVSQQEFSSAMVELQIATHINFRVVKDVQELGVHFIHYAKAIAVAPFKRQKLQDGLDWFAFSNSGNIKVDKEGNGLKTLWIDQLMQFNTVGIDTAQAIAAKYPSPVSLVEAYHRCTTIAEGLELLKDIPVRMGIGPLARTRKVGPEISKRVYRFFTCTSGERSLSRSHDH
ncbi:unnamed protein product [Allacma fusca]|uniref:ERCC4 domain-containing protein n=1 Tax=Allacma fusca TaxID=39272 RepID=A0A8J2L5V8_9HEXA|nr:unnamed protein product [Allacma fusca]